MVTHRASFLVLWVALVVACKPGPGSSCEKGEARCLDRQRQIVCQEGIYIETPCRGPLGCAQDVEGTSCDISKNRPGDPCSLEEQGSAACQDGKTMITCRSGKYVALACGGPNGCEREGNRALCDRSVAALGDDCDNDGIKACSRDSRQVLTCRDGQMATLLECRGDRGCLSVGSKLDCDLSIAAEGDPCEQKLEGHVGCTPDRDAMVTCHQGRFVLEEKCKAGRACVTEGSSSSCAKR
ncbi:MAG TPA: hypothetical protein VM686_33835 [Polyangiaceae bacterium]|nr:hypothetical protein [Polyangiaceae bacterium]